MAQRVADRLQKTPGTQDGNAPPPNDGLTEAQRKYGPNYEKLKQMRPDLVGAMQQLCLQFRVEAIYAQRQRIRRIKYARLFWQEIQYAYWDEGRGDFDFAGAGGGVQSNWGGEEEGATGPRYEFVTNWYQGYGLSFCALVSQDVPSLSISPKSREVHEDITAAKVGYDVADVIESNNDPHEALETIGRLLWTDGVVYQYWRYVVDGERFGYKEMPKIGLRVSDGMALPSDEGVEKIPHGQEVADYLGGLEVAAPIYADKFSDYGWLQWNSEPHMAQVKAAYPHAAPAIQQDTGVNAEQIFERLARLGVKQNIRVAFPGDALAMLPTFSRTWLRKWAFQALENKEHIAELEQLFPDGCYVAFCGFEYCESRNESMNDHWRVRHALPGDGQSRPAVGGALISPQERYNILSNLQTETYEYGIPPIYADPQVLDFDALANQVAEPAVHFPARAKPGASLADGFFQPSPAAEPTTLSATMQEIAGPVMQFLSGLFPAIFGGEMSDVKTAAGYAMARDQAMGRLGLIWRGVKKFYAEGIGLGLELFKKNRPEDVEVPFAGENDEEKAKWIRLADFRGNVMVKCESDEALPRLNSQQRAVLERLLGMGAELPPAIAKALEDPKNLGWIKTVMGLNEMTIPGENSGIKQMREIQMLVASAPIQFPKQPNQVAGPDGQPMIQMVQPPAQPTIGIDELLDDHELEFQTCFDWANSDQGQQARKENPAGFENVRLHAQMHVQAIQAKKQNAAKPPSASISFKDLSPSGKVQLAAQDNIQLDPNEIVAKEQQDRADKAAELQARLNQKDAGSQGAGAPGNQ
jgi:hypothetical protein